MTDSKTWWLLRVVADFAACKKWQQEEKNRDHASRIYVYVLYFQPRKLFIPVTILHLPLPYVWPGAAYNAATP